MTATGYQFGGFRFDLVAYGVTRGAEPLSLTPKLLDLLLYFLERPATLVTKEELLDALWPGANVTENALAQAETFQQWVGVSGIALTKLDGTAKGGIIFAIAKKLGLPIRYIGVGEGVEDLRPFQAEPFIDALFAVDDTSA